MKFRKDRMASSAMKGFTNATDAADYLVGKGVAFRDAHRIVGELVLACIDKNKSIEEMSLDELKKISPVFDNDLYEAVSLKTCVEKRLTTGAPGSEVMKKAIEEAENYINA
jgi:argininosuccinate lyase